MKVQIRNSRNSRTVSDLTLPASDAVISRKERELDIKAPIDLVTVVKEYGENPILKKFTGKEMNLDELNFLSKRLESLTGYELMKISAYADSVGTESVKDFINLTYSLSGLSLIDNFSDSRKNGKRIYLDKFGGISESELKTYDFETLAEETIQNEKTIVTKYGVLIDHDMILEQVYNGRTFPEFHYSSETVVDAVIQNKKGDMEFLYLPTDISSMEKVKARLGVESFGECSVSEIINNRLPEEIFKGLESVNTLDDLTFLNEMCQVVVKFDEVQMTQLEMAVEYAGAKQSTSVTGIAKHLSSFEINPWVHNDAEYGKFIITEAGLFDVDEMLLSYIDFEAFAKDKKETTLTESGFVTKGFVGATKSVTEMLEYAGEFSEPLEKREEDMETLRLYSPLRASFYENGEEDDYSLTGKDLTEYEEEIKSAIEKDTCMGEEARGLMHYFDESKAVSAKVTEAFPTVEVYQDELYGVLECRIKEPLTKEERGILEEFWTGQMADGWGEGFEQREIPVEDGNLYVSFWGHGQYILSEEELKGRENDQGMEMKMDM